MDKKKGSVTMLIDEKNFTSTLEKEIPIDIVDTSWCMLRSVEKTVTEYEDLKNAIKARGILKPLLLRRIVQIDGKVLLSLVDGLHRLTVAKDLGYTTVEGKILDDCSDDEALALQVITNIPYIDTKKAAIARQIKLIIERNSQTSDKAKQMSMGDIAQMMGGMKLSTLKDLLTLTKLPKEVQDLVDIGEIKLVNALQLAKLPDKDYTTEWVDRARTLDTSMFTNLVKNRVAEYRTKTVTSTDTKTKTFTPTPKYRSQREILDEISSPKRLLYIIEAKKLNPLEAMKEGLRFCLNIDAVTLQERIEAYMDLVRREEVRNRERVQQDAADKIQEYQKQLAKLRQQADGSKKSEI